MTTGSFFARGAGASVCLDFGKLDSVTRTGMVGMAGITSSFPAAGNTTGEGRSLLEFPGRDGVSGGNGVASAIASDGSAAGGLAVFGPHACLAQSSRYL